MTRDEAEKALTELLREGWLAFGSWGRPQRWKSSLPASKQTPLRDTRLGTLSSLDPELQEHANYGKRGPS